MDNPHIQLNLKPLLNHNSSSLSSLDSSSIVVWYSLASARILSLMFLILISILARARILTEHGLLVSDSFFLVVLYCWTRPTARVRSAKNLGRYSFVCPHSQASMPGWKFRWPSWAFGCSSFFGGSGMGGPVGTFVLLSCAESTFADVVGSESTRCLKWGSEYSGIWLIFLKFDISTGWPAITVGMLPL